MILTKNLLLLTKLLIVFGVLIESKPNWTYEFISVDIENETPDVLTIELHRNRVSRGVYTVSGIYDVKQELTDDFLTTIQTYYSPTGSSAYAKTPFYVPEMPLTDVINTFYKDMLMESILECSENALNVETTFVPPLAKGLTTLNNCKISTEKLPSVINTGYHKVVIKFVKQANITLTFIVKIEKL